jgi:hypothetical protein
METKKFWSPILGVTGMGTVYSWIMSAVRTLGYKNVEYDPVFDMADVGDAIEVKWFDRGAWKMVSFVRVV